MSSPTASPQRHRSPTCSPRAPAGTLPARPPPRCRTPPPAAPTAHPRSHIHARDDGARARREASIVPQA